MMARGGENLEKKFQSCPLTGQPYFGYQRNNLRSSRTANSVTKADFLNLSRTKVYSYFLQNIRIFLILVYPIAI